jgi:NADH:ubiquinone oxidoreductase subunit 6 (subunit J)
MYVSILIIAMLLFAIQAIRARRLIVSALWLAGVSALLAVMFYQLGAAIVAVIELSVGAGLVTVLFVFAISIAGEETAPLRALIPWGVAAAIVLATIVLLGWSLLPVQGAINQTETGLSLSTTLWEQRGLDVLVQMVLIFAGVMGLLGLLAEAKAPLEYPIAEEVASRRQRELDTLSSLGSGSDQSSETATNLEFKEAV